MNDPIISPWLIYWISRLDNAKSFFDVILPVSFVVSGAALFSMAVNADRMLASEKQWFDVSFKAFKIFAAIFGVSLTLYFFLPTTKTAIAMYVASQITPQTVQQAGDTIDKITDKFIDKIIKAKEAQ